jgi:aspartyl/glutamyl-tRNA(Asn/Gln) amidotransferase C subunit
MDNYLFTMNKAKLTNKLIQHIASLAELELNEKEIKRYKMQLQDIINYFNKLSNLDIKNIIPTSHVGGIVNKFRIDKVKYFLKKKNALFNATSIERGYFKTKLPFKK